MTLTTNKLAEDFSVCPQITAEDVAEIAQLGFKTIINNRPDAEGGAEQPSNASIQAAAEKLGLQYFYIPVIPNQIQEAEVAQFAKALEGAAKPALAFCRTGNRAAKLYSLAIAK